MTTDDFYKLPQINRDVAYFHNLANDINQWPQGFADWMMRIADAARKQVAKPVKYFPELNQFYCPVCGSAIEQYQNYCGDCGQAITGTHIYNCEERETINQEPVINNETGAVDWGETE